MIRRFRAISFVALAAAAGVVLLSPGDQNARPTPGEPAAAQAATIRPSYIAANAPVVPAAVPKVVAASTPVDGVKLPLPPSTAEPETTMASLDAATALPDAEAPDTQVTGTAARVGGSALNVRAGPSSSTSKLFVLQPGTPVTVTESNNGWSYVVTADGEGGWVFSRYLSNGAAPPSEKRVAVTEPQEETPRAVKKQREPKSFVETGRLANSVTLRAGPSRAAPKLFSIKAGERVAVAEVRGRWMRIVMESGASGWILTKARSD